MNASALFAFIHHVAAFTLAGALIAELALFERNLNLRQARKIQRVDLAYGISAGVLLVAGLLRVFYFEKGGSYYFHNLFFMAKLSLFIIVALLSVYPTVLFVSWNKQLKIGNLPQLEDAQVRRVRAIILLELLGIVGILLCASLMARGIGMIEERRSLLQTLPETNGDQWLLGSRCPLCMKLTHQSKTQRLSSSRPS